MANTYTQIYIQTIFAVKGRHSIISESWEDELFKYITGIIRNKKQTLLAINGHRNHIHILINLKPVIALSDLIRDIKNNSTNFINDKKFIKGKFSWQIGFGAFSYSYSQIDSVIKYIMNQKQHHKSKTFKAEYFEFLKKFQINYDERYVFDFDE